MLASEKNLLETTAAAGEDGETLEDRKNLVKLTKELNYQRGDLHSFVPARQL